MYLGALKYKISDRIAKLAKPADDNTEFVDDDEFFKVRQSALKGNFKQDVEKLAQHKVRQSMDAAQFLTQLMHRILSLRCLSCLRF